MYEPLQLHFTLTSLRATHWLAPLQLDGDPCFESGMFKEAAPSGGWRIRKVHSAELFLKVLEAVFAGRRGIQNHASLHITACIGEDDIIQEQITLLFNFNTTPTRLTITIDEHPAPERRRPLFDRLARNIATIPGVRSYTPTR